MVLDLEWIINWGQRSPITVMLAMFSRGIQHSLASWEMMEDLDGIEFYQVVMVSNRTFDNILLFYILNTIFYIFKVTPLKYNMKVWYRQ